jgi:iron complex transport system permease protein
LRVASLAAGARELAWAQLFTLHGDTWLTLTASRLPRLAH